MTKALFNLGIALCDDVAAFAPKTRRKRIKAIDLTASALEVRGSRLRALLERAFAGTAGADSMETVDESVTRILEIVAAWRTADDRPAGLDAAAQLIRERGELFLTLHRRQSAYVPGDVRGSHRR